MKKEKLTNLYGKNHFINIISKMKKRNISRKLIKIILKNIYIMCVKRYIMIIRSFVDYKLIN